MTSLDFEYVTDNIEGGPVFRDIGTIVTSVITLLQLTNGFVFYTGKNSRKICLVNVKRKAHDVIGCVKFKSGYRIESELEIEIYTLLFL